MPKPLSQIGHFFEGMSKLSASDMEAIRQAAVARITVAAPLVMHQGGSGDTQLGVNGELLPAGTQGEMLVHDGENWVAVAVPAVFSIWFFNTATGMPQWIPITTDCPSVTTTTAAATTTTA